MKAKTKTLKAIFDPESVAAVVFPPVVVAPPPIAAIAEQESGHELSATQSTHFKSVDDNLNPYKHLLHFEPSLPEQESFPHDFPSADK